MFANIDLLVAALRSGRYQKTENTLRHENCFCALGVACDVAIANGAAAYWDEYEYCVDRVTGEKRHGCLPECVSKFYGLSPLGNFPSSTGRYPNISTMNDLGDLTFSQMADIIEKEFVNVD